MSIPNLIYKIKSKISIDKITIMYLLIIVGVGVSSFGLGRISVYDSSYPNNKAKTEIKEVLGGQNTLNTNTIPKIQIMDEKKMYVASKNGKIYYGIECSGAKRIKVENEIWFSSKTNAEKSGYTLSSTCK